jgi:hypothetical protein
MRVYAIAPADAAAVQLGGSSRTSTHTDWSMTYLQTECSSRLIVSTVDSTPIESLISILQTDWSMTYLHSKRPYRLADSTVDSCNVSRVLVIDTPLSSCASQAHGW